MRTEIGFREKKRRMLVERIDPDWQWTKYRKVSLFRDDGPKLSYPSKYQPVTEASTLHRSLAKASEDQRFTTTKIKNRDERRDKRKQFHEHWLTSFGKLKDEIIIPLAAGDEFDELHFNTEAGFVWWIVQVFDVLRKKELDPTKVEALEAATDIMIDVPNPAKVASEGDDFFPFQRAVLDPPPDPATMLDGSVNDHSSYIQRNISRDQETWSVNYLELLEVLGITISGRLQDGVKLGFESLDPETRPVAKGFNLGEATLTGFPFLDVQRGRFGSRSDKKIKKEDLENKNNPLRLKIVPVLQPQDLLTYIWMLCAEELVELPDVEFEPCKNFDECGNVLKRDRARSCKHCNKMVVQHKEAGFVWWSVVQRKSTYAHAKKSDADYVDYTECSKSFTKVHEVRNHQREYCTQNCSAKQRSKTSKSG